MNRHPLAFDVGHGDPAYSTALQLQATQAELVVVGKRRSSLLVHFSPAASRSAWPGGLTAMC